MKRMIGIIVVAISVLSAGVWSYPGCAAETQQKTLKEQYAVTGQLIKQVFDNVDFFLKKAGPTFTETEQDVFSGQEAKEKFLKNYQLCTDKIIDGMPDPETGERPIVESMIRKMWKRVLGYKKQLDEQMKLLESDNIAVAAQAVAQTSESRQILEKKRATLKTAIKMIREEILVNLKDAAKVVSSSPEQLKILETLLSGRPFAYSAMITMHPRHPSECVARKMFERYQDIKEKAFKAMPENLESILKILDAELETLNRKLN